MSANNNIYIWTENNNMCICIQNLYLGHADAYHHPVDTHLLYHTYWIEPTFDFFLPSIWTEYEEWQTIKTNLSANWEYSFP